MRGFRTSLNLQPVLLERGHRRLTDARTNIVITHILIYYND